MLWHLDIAKLKRRRIVPSLPQESARYRTIVVVDYAARHYLDIHWYAHTMTPRMHHERTTPTCISVSRATRFYESIENANGCFVHASLSWLAAHSTTRSIRKTCDVGVATMLRQLSQVSGGASLYDECVESAERQRIDRAICARAQTSRC